ncbi:MAG: hypothetical protein ACKOET_04825 [Verrucomicrobiota bacterium]
MKTWCFLGLLATFLGATSVWADPGAPESESVPVQAALDPNNPFALVRPNVFDLDSLKLLTFVGTATQEFDPTGAPTPPGTLIGFFDWRGTSGVDFLSPASFFSTAPNQPVPVEFSWVIDFCPSQVSLHFESPNGRYTVSGTFTHECLPVPEASAVVPSLSLAAGVAGWAWRRRRTSTRA